MIETFLQEPLTEFTGTFSVDIYPGNVVAIEYFLERPDIAKHEPAERDWK